MKRTDDFDMSKIEEKEYKHGEIAILPHRIFINYYEKEDNTICDGKVYWDEGLEGFCCTKCQLYTGVK